MVEAVGIEPTSGNPQPQASTSISGLSYVSLALRLSNRQEDRGASLIYLALPLRRSSGPATRISCRFPGPDGSTWPTLAVVRRLGLAGCRPIFRSHLLTGGLKP